MTPEEIAERILKAVVKGLREEQAAGRIRFTNDEYDEPDASAAVRKHRRSRIDPDLSQDEINAAANEGLVARYRLGGR